MVVRENEHYGGFGKKTGSLMVVRENEKYVGFEEKMGKRRFTWKENVKEVLG